MSCDFAEPRCLVKLERKLPVEEYMKIEKMTSPAPNRKVAEGTKSNRYIEPIVDRMMATEHLKIEKIYEWEICSFLNLLLSTF